MNAYQVLIPTSLNDGSPVPFSTRNELDTIALDQFGGFTDYGEVQGAWRDPATAIVYRDRLRVVEIATDKEDDFWRYVRVVGVTLRQYSMYAKRGDGRVEIVSTDEWTREGA